MIATVDKDVVEHYCQSLLFLTLIFLLFVLCSEPQVLRKDVIVVQENDLAASRSQTHLD